MTSKARKEKQAAQPKSSLNKALDGFELDPLLRRARGVGLQGASILIRGDALSRWLTTDSVNSLSRLCKQYQIFAESMEKERSASKRNEIFELIETHATALRRVVNALPFQDREWLTEVEKQSENKIQRILVRENGRILSETQYGPYPDVASLLAMNVMLRCWADAATVCRSRTDTNGGGRKVRQEFIAGFVRNIAAVIATDQKWQCCTAEASKALSVWLIADDQGLAKGQAPEGWPASRFVTICESCFKAAEWKSKPDATQSVSAGAEAGLRPYERAAVKDFNEHMQRLVANTMPLQKDASK